MKSKRSASNLPARSLLCCALATCLFASMPAMAQSSNAILRGQAQAGAEVVVTNTATGSVRRTPACLTSAAIPREPMPRLPPSSMR